MAVQQYVVRYFNSKVYSKPIIDKDGRSRGGHSGWTEFYVYGQKVAKAKAREMAAIVGKENVTYSAFNDPVKNPYKRQRNKKSSFSPRKETRRDFSEGSYDPFSP